jgi:membrane-bound lytic murein transglycosylase D
MRTHGVLLSVLVVIGAGPVAAQPDDNRGTSPGVQPVPPTDPGNPSLEPNADGRRAVRGCPVDVAECRGHDRMREIEHDLFPEPGQGPWIDDRTPGASRIETARTKVTRPSQLRPDLRWLDKLDLPDLPVEWTPRLIDFLVFYKDDPRGRNIMKGWLEAQGRYRDLILTHLRKAKLPEDLLYVVMIESSYDPLTKSYAGASGLWQFMPEGGRIYGLRIDRWVDERNDPLRSTIAVLDYWKDLYQRFGDWHLALAAYNAGYGAILRVIARHNTNDFWRLGELENGLPWGTTLYVPKALACAIVGRNRAVFGLAEVAPAPAEVWDEVAVPQSIGLATIARAAGAPVDAIARLNPHLRRNRTPPDERGYVVRVPRGTGAPFGRRLADLRSEWDRFDAYVVAHGERFEDVATTFGLSTRKLRELNGITHDAEVHGGATLVVPRIAADVREKNRAKAIANLHASGPDQKPGEPLIVAVPDKDATEAGKRRVFYRISAGDELGAIARVLGVRSSQLEAWNQIAGDAPLQPRMIVQAWVAADFDPVRANVRLLDDDKLLVVTRGSAEHMDLVEARVGRERVEYTPKKSETLEQIGKKFGLGKRDLARINRIKDSAVIEPGQSITVYRVVDRTRSERAAEQWKKTPKSQKKPARERAPAASKKRTAGPVSDPDQVDDEPDDAIDDER